MELFINGNPRFLSGGRGSTDISYESVPPVTTDVAGQDITTATIPPVSPAAGVVGMGQTVYSGKVSYHHTPSYNVFLRAGEWPSAGIELETHLRRFDSAFAELTVGDLKSNWFHFERDGSLDRAHSGAYGYELITCPLPPRAYRDQRLWTGLQNLCSPYLQSFQCQETGLHVHVGLNQFEKFDGIPLGDPVDRRSIGKLLSTVVYYCVADPAFVDRVVLRKQTGYCSMADCREFTDARRLVDTGKATGAAMVDYCTAVLLKQSMGLWESQVQDDVRMLAAGGPVDGTDYCSRWIGNTSLACGHGTEINQEHLYTIEFRRPKGTMHALSIHRIVELMTSIVRFAGKLCREPDLVVTREAFLDWLIQTTTSEALRNLARQTRG